MNLLASLVTLILISGGLPARQIPGGRHCVERGKGQFLILVGSAGLLGVFGHDHTIEAKEITGCADVNEADLTRSSVELTFAAGKITVLDPKESQKDRTQVQQTMETDVLRVREFPAIRFRSTGVSRDRNKTNGFIVQGQLTIRDRMQPAAIPVEVTRAENGLLRVKGEYSLRQTAFGIEPVKVAGGTVRVKDELKVRFELYLK
ncbi:MAG TPA: YceI family protein [Terriglobia bacterium]|nr:YceI family protein [Terriglobia bacterium]